MSVKNINSINPAEQSVQIQTSEQVYGDSGKIDIGAIKERTGEMIGQAVDSGTLAINSIRRRILAHRVNRLGQQVQQHEEEQEFFAELNEIADNNMPHDTSTTEARPKTPPATYGVVATNPLSRMAAAENRLLERRKHGTTRPDGSTIDVTWKDIPSEKRDRRLAGHLMARGMGPPTKRAERAEKALAKRLRAHEQETGKMKLEEGSLGLYTTRSVGRIRRAYRGARHDRGLDPYQRIRAREDRRAETIRKTKRRSTKQAARVNQLRQGTVQGTERAFYIAEADAGRKRRKQAKLEDKLSSL